MATEEPHSLAHSLNSTPVDRKLVDILFAQGIISKPAYDFSRNLIDQPRQWNTWLMRFFGVMGGVLILSSLVGFAQFFWQIFSPIFILFAIQLAMIACVVGAYYAKLENLRGKVLLLVASILVGVFLAVWEHIYGMSGDIHLGFLRWSLLILGWALCANFALQWLLWLIITNFFFATYWQDIFPPWHALGVMVFPILAIFNALALASREYIFVRRRHAWLGGSWVRITLICSILLMLFYPIFWLTAFGTSTKPIFFAVTFGLIGYAVLFYIYRYKIFDLGSLAIIIFVVCLTFLLGIMRVDMVLFESQWNLLVKIFLTLILFSAPIAMLRNLAKRRSK